MAIPGGELQSRVCRACGQRYDYPVKHSEATRFYCATCALLPEPVRATFERMGKRIKELERRLHTPPKKADG